MQHQRTAVVASRPTIVDAYTPYGGRWAYFLLRAKALLQPLLLRLREVAAQLWSRHKRVALPVLWALLVVIIARRLYTFASRRGNRSLRDKRGDDDSKLNASPDSPFAPPVNGSPRIRHPPIDAQFDNLLTRFASEEQVGAEHEEGSPKAAELRPNAQGA